jgi:site-specific recombinase XerD
LCISLRKLPAARSNEKQLEKKIEFLYNSGKTKQFIREVLELNVASVFSFENTNLWGADKRKKLTSTLAAIGERERKKLQKYLKNLRKEFLNKYQHLIDENQNESN